jgi:hypothetical protein
MKIIPILKEVLLNEVSESLIKKLVAKFQKEESSLSEDDIRYALDSFERIKNSLEPNERDITKYDWVDLVSVLDLEDKTTVSRKDRLQIQNAAKIHEDNSIKIYKAKTHKTCLALGKGHAFCISMKIPAFFQNYSHIRAQDKFEKLIDRSKAKSRFHIKQTNDDIPYPTAPIAGTIYFVRDKTKEPELTSKGSHNFKDPDYLIVIVAKQLINDKGEFHPEIRYEVTNANNQNLNEFDGTLSWNSVVGMYPKLRGKEKYFKVEKADEFEKQRLKVASNIGQRINELLISELGPTAVEVTGTAHTVNDLSWLLRPYHKNPTTGDIADYTRKLASYYKTGEIRAISVNNKKCYNESSNEYFNIIKSPRGITFQTEADKKRAFKAVEYDVKAFHRDVPCLSMVLVVQKLTDKQKKLIKKILAILVSTSHEISKIVKKT